MDLNQICSGLTRRADGVWSAPDTATVSYPSDGHQACFNVEENSFWFNHRNRCIAAAINKFPPGKGATIFDIGGGNGAVSSHLKNCGFNVALVEPGETGVRNAVNRGVETVICATTKTAGFLPEALPAAGLFDVIEHIEDDAEFLSHINQLLIPEGKLYLTAPAYQTLWSQEDVTAGHFRRYRLANLCKLLKEAGYKVNHSTYIFRFLPLPILLSRTLPYLLKIDKAKSANRTTKDHIPGDKRTRSMLDRLLAPEVRNIEQERRMLFGGSCLIVASKNPSA